MKRLVCLVFLFLFCTVVRAEEKVMYRLILTDKGVSSYDVEHPEDFLSPKSIERRSRQGFPVDETDLPLSPDYFEALIATGVSIQTYSKWVKTVVVTVPDEATIDVLRNLPFVQDLYPVFKGNVPDEEQPEEAPATKSEQTPAISLFDFSDYGDALTQISLNNGHLLHQLGYNGHGLTIAVMDDGFLNADQIDYFNQDQILGIKNFTHEKGNPFRSNIDHGTKVLSCMLADKPGEMIGTAPEAEYYLFKTEVNGSEYPVEEDYWIAALEYADSLGVDIVSTSLGYFMFDDPSMDHTQTQLDGETATISRAASMAAYKGMVLCNSAGNEGNKSWVKIIFPADAENILTVGAVMSDSTRSSFSSLGYTGDGRVKPDVMAMGSAVTLVGSDGKTTSNGTSFSCPVIAGQTASLWQALPQLNSLDLISLIRKTANRYQNPDNEYGYGIADFFKAYNEGKNEVSIPVIHAPDYLFPDTSGNRIYIKNGEHSQARLFLYTSMGIKILEQPVSSSYIDIHSLNKGIYIALLQIENKQYVRKFIKQ